MPSGIFYLHNLDRSISITNVEWLVLIITMFLVFPVSNANSEDPNKLETHVWNILHDSFEWLNL